VADRQRTGRFKGNLRRWLLASAGVVSVGFGALGAVLPGLPTTIFLIIASYCFARSCPWLEQRLLRNRLFAPYMAWIDGREPMPRRAKAAAIAAVWTAVIVSLSLLYSGGQLPPWLAAVVTGAALIGTFAIANDLAMRMLRVRDRASGFSVEER
jgi:uncharacterized membrane protein YbaN (DUF454 family)